MDADKKINPADLPQEPRRTTTQQPEEYIDNSNLEKDSDDQMPRSPAGKGEATERERGEQETT